MATDIAVPDSEQAQASGQFSTFYVADMFFGVDVLQVQEVLRAQQMSPVPMAPDVIEGLINLRGQIVTAIDMRRQLLLPPRAEGQAPMNMVVRTSDGAVSLLVDEIGDVLAMDAANCERPPENLDPNARELIRGVYKLKDRLLLVLDTERAVEVNCNGATRNGRREAGRAEGTPGTRRQFSTSPEAAAADNAEPAQFESSAKKTTRKAAGKKTNGAAGKA